MVPAGFFVWAKKNDLIAKSVELDLNNRMWDSIWHLRGSTPLTSGASDDEVMHRLETLLQYQRKPVTSRNGSELVFDDPLFRDLLSPNWLAMVIYDHGHFWIEHGLKGRILRYDLRSLHGFVFCLFGAAMSFAFGFAGGGLPEALRTAAFAFGWLYGTNLLLAWTRIPRKIRKAVS